MQPTLAQVCSLQSPWEKDIEDYAAGACRSIEIWFGKLESYLERHSVADARRVLEQHEVVAPVASYQGGLLTSQGDARQEHWQLFSRRLQLCRELGIRTIVVAADIVGPLTQTDLDRVQVSLQQAAALAGQHGVRVALEFQARAAFCNNLQTAAALIAETGSPHLGICLDAFHFNVGPSKTEDLGYLKRENLFHVQLSDLSGQPREFAADADRILPGDGDFVWEPLLARLREIGYADCVSIEVLNPELWQVPPRQFGEIAMTALRKLLGIASMG